jgi:hypothetical protein
LERADTSLIRRGKFGEDFFTLSSIYFQGQPPKSVNFHWRRFRVADIPLETQEAFELWLRDRFYEKDAMMEKYLSTGRFDALPDGSFIETEVRTRYSWEFVQIFIMLGAFGLVWNVLGKFWAGLH